jgi:glycosyltransferase involved in cell wall biosynthesis
LSITPRIAIACSGLGHVQRGVESWASDLAGALRRTGADVTLFGAGPGDEAEIVVLPALRRTGKAAIAVATGLRHLGGWRYGLGSPYDVEQTSFAVALLQRVRKDFDIVHVQDPTIATWLERAHRIGLSRPAVVYANGTGEDASVMRRFSHLQLLTRAGFQSWMPHKPHGQAVYMIPNFVDTARFCPGDQADARARFGLPPDRTIVLCCAAIRRYHKRIDVLLESFAEMCRGRKTDAILVIAGGREADTDTLMATGKRLLGQRVRFLPDLPRDSMPDLYRAADAFVLPSLHEMFGIVLLEALATGLPVLCNDTPDFRAIVGPGGLYRDLGTQDKLASGLSDLLDLSASSSIIQSGRSHVEALFSEQAVIGALLAMYRSILAEVRRAGQ